MTEARVNLTIAGIPADRWIVAQHFRRRLAEARAACGPSETYAIWILRDKLGIEPDRIHYSTQRGVNIPEQLFGELLNTRDESRFAYVFISPDPAKPSIHAYPMRYELSCGVLDSYEPKTQDELDRMRERREEKRAARARAADIAAAPLFHQELEAAHA